MNDTINELQADLKQAEEALTSINEAITEKRQALAEAEADRERLDSLILLKGDTQAMLDIMDVRSTINGLNTHLADLTRAETAAVARRDESEANLLGARIRARDAEGAMTDEQLNAECLKTTEQLDKITHQLYAKIEAHNQAGKELTALGRKMLSLRGQTASWDYRALPIIHTSSIHAEHVAKSLDRYEAPRLAKEHALQMKRAKEAADIQREQLETSALMFNRTSRASAA